MQHFILFYFWWQIFVTWQPKQLSATHIPRHFVRKKSTKVGGFQGISEIAIYIQTIGSSIRLPKYCKNS
jgi:hypothetical protein